MPKFKNLRIAITDDPIQIVDNPNSITKKIMVDPDSKLLMSMILHYDDLSFCRQALNEIVKLKVPQNNPLIEGLWVSLIIKFFKCFTNNKSRSKLSPKIFKNNSESIDAFCYFKSLRDKHIAHDENSYMQALVGIVVNSKGNSPKIANILAVAVHAETMDSWHLPQITQLVEVALDWVTEKLGELQSTLEEKYEQWSYEDLLSLPDLRYKVPTNKEVQKIR